MDQDNDRPPQPKFDVEDYINNRISSITPGHLLPDGTLDPKQKINEIDNKLGGILSNITLKKLENDDQIRRALQKLAGLYPEEEEHIRGKVKNSPTLSKYIDIFKKNEEE